MGTAGFIVIEDRFYLYETPDDKEIADISSLFLDDILSVLSRSAQQVPPGSIMGRIPHRIMCQIWEKPNLNVISLKIMQNGTIRWTMKWENISQDFTVGVEIQIMANEMRLVTGWNTCNLQYDFKTVDHD